MKKCQKQENKQVSNYENRANSKYEGYINAIPLRLVLIVVVQRREEECEVGPIREMGVDWIAVRAGTSLICSQLSCSG